MRLLFIISILFSSIPAYSNSQISEIIDAADDYSRSSDPNKIHIETCAATDCIKKARDLYKQKEFTFALPFYERAYELDDHMKGALTYLNVIYRDGLGVEVDPVKANYYFTKRKELSNVLVTDTDINDLQSDANNNDVSAQFKLAKLYGAGVMVEKDPQESRAWLIIAAENNHEVAQYGLSKKLYKENRKDNKEVSVEWMKKSAKNGYLKAQFELGNNLIHDGDGVMEGLFWLGVAAERGHFNAARVLNVYYFIMINEISRKTSKYKKYYPELTIDDVVVWFKHRAKNGDTLAQRSLYRIYGSKELKVFYDIENSKYWHDKWMSTLLTEADKGSHLAMVELAQIYRKGEGVEIDLNKSLHWHEKSLIFKKNNARFEIPRIKKELGQLPK